MNIKKLFTKCSIFVRYTGGVPNSVRIEYDENMNRPLTKDWNGIKKAYLEGKTYRAISKEYHVALATISQRAKEENWELLKRRIATETEQKIVDRLSDRHARIADKVTIGVEACVDKVITGLKGTKAADYQKIRAYMSVLKDAKEMGIFKSEIDMAEQTARIKKLEKDASTLEQDNTINVVISSEVEEYAN